MPKTTRTLTVIVFEPGKPAALREIEDSLESMQAVVGGDIELVRAEMRAGSTTLPLTVVCDEEAKLKHRPFNRRIGGQAIAGTFFLASQKYGSGKIVSLSDKMVKLILFGPDATPERP